MDAKQLVEVLRNHDRYVRGLAGGARADLRGQDFSGLKLAKVNLEGAILSGAHFTDGVIAYANFSAADLFCANFDRADATGANFRRSDLRGSSFRGAKLTDSCMDEADIRAGASMNAPTHRARPVGC